MWIGSVAKPFRAFANCMRGRGISFLRVQELIHKADEFNLSFIKNNTDLIAVEGLPDIPLLLVQPHHMMFRYTEKDIVESQLRGNPPFWAFVWPGGYGLTRYISENPHLFWNKTVVDFGCGCGSASVAAWRAGCRGVLSNDIDPLALLATSLNCNNNLGIQDPFNICCSGVDYLYHKNKIELFDEAVSICERQSKETKDATAEDSRILLVGDMLYDHDIGPEVMKLIERLINNKWIVYIGEPGRDFALKIVQKLGDVVMSYQLPQDIKSQNNGLNEVTVRKLSLV